MEYARRSNEFTVQYHGEVVRSLPTPTRSFLETQAWAFDSDPVSGDLLEILRLAERCRENMRAKLGETFSAPISILQTVSVTDWFSDGLTVQEKWHATNLYRTYLDVANYQLLSGQRVGDPAELILSAHAAGLIEWRHRTFLALGADTDLRRKAFDLMLRYVQPVSDFAGVLQPAGIVVFLVDLEPELCGATNGHLEAWRMQLVLVDHRCVTPTTVAHEVTHAFLGGRYPTWYTEGIATYLASKVTGEASVLETLELPAHSFQLEAKPTALGERLVQYAAGFRLLSDMSNLLGEDILKATVRNVRPEATGRTILDDLRARTPVELREALEALIRKYVGP